MNFLIADTFTDSLAKLANQERKAVKETAFDLQVDPTGGGKQFHKLNRAKDPNFWSVRVNQDIRLIVHRSFSDLLLCYVDHHDRAYAWAERRRIDTHPTTGAAQLVELPVEQAVEAVRFSGMPVQDDGKNADRLAAPQPVQLPLFAGTPDADLLGYGVPAERLGEVRRATEDTLFDLADHLPQKAAEALLDLATGITPKPVTPEVDPFAHPDALRRFRRLENVEELARALDYPQDKWTVSHQSVQEKKTGTYEASAPKAATFRNALHDLFEEAEHKGLSHIDIKAGDLHRQVGGYPGNNHRMPQCCNAMRTIMTSGDVILSSPPSGKGATLTIRYRLPRGK